MSAFVSSLYPFESKFFKLEAGSVGTSMHYLDQGQGPVVLLLHGNPTWSFYYRNLVLALRDKFRVIVPDQIGCGLSDKPQDQFFTAAQRVDHLQQLLRHLNVEKYSLVLHDWGGAIGTRLALQDPQQIEKIVYLNTTLTDTENLPLVIRLSASPAVGQILTQFTKFFLYVTTNWGVFKKLPAQVKRAYMQVFPDIKSRKAIWGFVSDIPFSEKSKSYADLLELAENLPKLKTKAVQVIWGMRDPCFNHKILNSLLKHFPTAQVHELQEASHLVLEDQTQVCCDLIKNFLSSEIQNLGTNQQANSQEASLYQKFSQLATDPDFNYKPAIISAFKLCTKLNFQQLSFAQLQNLIWKYQRGLQQLGLSAGDKVLMLVPFKPFIGVECLALAYACIGSGAIPVFIDPGMGRKNLTKCIADINPDFFIGIPKAHLLRKLNKDIFARLKAHLYVTKNPLFRKNLNFLNNFAAAPLAAIKPDPEQTCFIAFTSGATGVPKGVPFIHKMLLAQLEVFKNELSLKAGQKNLPLLPIFSIFNLALGVTTVFPLINPANPIGLDPKTILNLISDLEIDSAFGAPTLWEKILEFSARQAESLNSLKTLMLAGAPVPRSILQKLQALVPNADIHTPYGATECLPVTVVSSQQILTQNLETALSGELGTFVGRPIVALDLKIIEAASNQVLNDFSQVKVLAPYQIGEIIVRGDLVSKQYFNRAEATQKSKIVDAAGFWHRMGDLGYLDSAGNLYFCGRQNHLIKASSGEFHSVPIENIFNQHNKVKKSALVAVLQEPAIVIEPHPCFWPDSQQAQENLKRELLDLAKTSKLTSRIEKILFHPSLPVDKRHSAKILREQLTVWANKQVN